MFVDNSRNVFVTGGNGVTFVTIKYNSSGIQQWVQLGYSRLADAVAVDGSGAVYVLRGLGDNYGGAVVKYNSNGVWQWAQLEQWVHRYNGPGNGDDRASSLSVNTNGNVFVTGRSWNGTNFDYATINYSQNIQPIPQPSISVTPVQINAGGNVNITGQNFRANTQVKVTVTSSNSELVHDQIYTTNSTGGVTVGYSSNLNSSPGIYTVSCRDIFTNQSAANIIFEIKEQPETFDMIFVSPDTDSVSNYINIEWQDKMFTGSMYQIDTNKRHYKYMINYSTDNGLTWLDSIFFQGKEYVGQISIFNKKINLIALRF
ncbi:MAG: hypothetical protein IPM96_14165 [Ignavibacteria bacterium]|nr:hypothetical protein [Ignavibacteria bacterium]